MDRILGGIYVGSYQPLAANVDLKEKYKITHILSVIKGDLPPGIDRKYQIKRILIDDIPSENVVELFSKTNEFIDEALFPANIPASEDPKKQNSHRGAILIHCSEGVSRSVTFTVAYLMYKYKLSLQNALHAVQRKRSAAQPNVGFMEQLKIYEEALEHHDYRNDIDLSDEQSYRDWLFKNLMEDEEARNQYLADDNTYGDTDASAVDLKSGARISQLRCKKCRQALALSTSFIPHDKPEQNSRHSNFFTTSGYSNRIIGVTKAAEYCTHIFTEPLNWMKEELQGKGELLGKFYCPNEKCGTKVGGYSWKGSRCSCGKWVVPAISLQTAKVDEIVISKNPNFEQIKTAV